MKRLQALEYYKSSPLIKPDILITYKDADTHFYINDNDPDLTAQRINLPEPPVWHLIDGFGEPCDEQYWRIPPTPKKILKLIDKHTFADDVWNELQARQKYYKDEILWIKRQWHYRLYGYWFFNNGKPTFLDGWHYWYLAVYNLDIGAAEYRDRDRRWFLFARDCATTTKAPVYSEWDDKGRPKKVAVDDNGDVKLKDYGRLICYGFCYPKHRRDGATHKSISVGLEIGTRSIAALIGLQSYTSANAKTQFSDKLVPAFQKIPFYFKPMVDSSTNPKENISCNAPAERNKDGKIILYKKKELKTKFDYAQTSDKSYYNGKKLKYILSDEEGNCFGKDTPIRMYNGDVKMVQDILPGDLLMGDDSIERNVLSTVCGQDDLYKIIPNKGDPWVCNSNHILVCKISDESQFYSYKYKKGQIIELTVLDYLKLSKYQKRGLVLYSVGVDYPEKQHIIDPYLYGLWLGDGASAEPAITNVDKEVINYIYNYAKEGGYKVVIKEDGITYRLSKKRTAIFDCYDRNNNFINRYHSRKDAATKLGLNENLISNYTKYVGYYKGYKFISHGRQINYIQRFLSSNNLIRNKHIIKDYLVDSIDNRLKLLAGIIDTDGHRCTTKNKCVYEITLKLPILAEQVKDLALSCGFGSTIHAKIATLKRPNKPIYTCPVYRVRIYGFDMHRIHCLIPRKKMPIIENKNKNSRNPKHTGFRVELMGVGNYYGFIIDGNRRFLLSDYTVVHNTRESQEDIFDRWNVVKECQSIGDEIVGFSIHPTTVEEANAVTISNFRRLCEQSRFEQINELTGQTASGLRTLFIPAYDGMKGFIDKHGLSVISNPTPDQAAFIKKNYGAKDFISSQRQILLSKGTPTAMRQYHRFVELFPTTYAECFQGASTSIGFNTVKINDQLAELYRLTGKDKPIRGNFEFEGGDQTGKVVFKENPDGRFLLSHMPPEEIRSKRVLKDGIYYPAFPGKYVAGGDPFEFSTKTEAQLRESRERMSDGGGAVLRLRDMNIDPDNKEVSEWETYNIVCTYRYRPAGSEYSWDMIKMCVYFGSMMYLENNIKTLWRDFIEFGFGGYLLHDIDNVTGKIVEKPGFWAGAAANQDRFNSVRDYIEYHSARIKHDDFLEECKRMRGIEYLKDCDLVSAVSAALLGAKSAYNRYMQQMTAPNDNSYDFSSFYKKK